MAEYLLTYHGGGGAAQAAAMTEDQRNASMAKWMAWFGSMGEAVVDGGRPIGEMRFISPDGSVMTEAQRYPVSGYSVLRADSMAAAVQLAQGCPVLQDGGSIQVSETIAM